MTCHRLRLGAGPIRGERSTLTLKTLSGPQRAVYRQIMAAPRRDTEENRNEALLEIQRCKDLVAESGWWVAGPSEPPHLQSSLALLQALAMI